MESNVVKFILENIYIFIPLGSAGIVATCYLYYTGKTADKKIKDNLDDDYVVFSKININFFVIIYLFIFVMMIIIGALSDFLFPAIIGGVFTLIPIILLILTKSLLKSCKL